MRPHELVHVDVESPGSFDRAQVVLRLLLAAVLGAIGVTGSWLVGLLFVALPLIAAVSVSTTSSSHFITEVGPRLERALRWLLQLSAYMLLLVDRFPTSDAAPVRIEIRREGAPTVGSALARVVTSIPSALVLCLLWCVSSLFWIVGAITILVSRCVPGFVLRFQRGVLRWQTHLLAYHASLVAEYPPFSFDGELHHHTDLTAGASV